MGAMQSAVPTIVGQGMSLATTLATDNDGGGQRQRPLVVQPPPIDEDPKVQDILTSAERKREKTLLDRDRRKTQRAEELEAEQARARVRAAANNTAGGGSADAIREDNRTDIRREQRFDDRETANRLDRIDAERRRNVLDIARDRRRAAIGLRHQLNQTQRV